MNELSGSGADILLVDDDAAIRVLISEFLNLGCYTVVTAANGQEALNHYQNNKPGLLITDIDMPLINGLELIQQVRADTKEVPIIAISGDASHLIAAENLGVKGAFIKPIDFTQFMEAVGELLTSKP